MNLQLQLLAKLSDLLLLLHKTDNLCVCRCAVQSSDLEGDIRSALQSTDAGWGWNQYTIIDLAWPPTFHTPFPP